MAADVDLLSTARSMRRGGQSLESTIHALREHGSSKGQSVLIVAEVYELDTANATRAVHESAAWRDRMAADEELNASMWGTLEKSGQPQQDGSVDITDWLNSEDDKT